jgi:hypothetical protein
MGGGRFRLVVPLLLTFEQGQFFGIVYIDIRETVWCCSFCISNGVR